jgi:hypothetical protein
MQQITPLQCTKKLALENCVIYFFPPVLQYLIWNFIQTEEEKIPVEQIKLKKPCVKHDRVFSILCVSYIA